MSRIAVVLAGGEARRMGFCDKGEALFGGRRLIDCVVGQLSNQVDEILIAGPHNYGLAFGNCPDLEDGPRGPAAGLFAGATEITGRKSGEKGFLCVPVDAPFLPLDLFDKLRPPHGAAVAATRSGVHPTFGYWEIGPLIEHLHTKESPSLKSLATQLGAQEVFFEDGRAFTNLNSQEDIRMAQTLINQE
ncbi:MAG: molybdenum cofactor guanylyltransferase [Pseudomonadota bacterium]